MNYENLLREHGLKVTPQRLGILALMEAHGHINIDEMYKEIKKQFPSISLATMYKNINAMTEASLVKEVKVPQQKARYEIIKAPHGHLLCDKCGEFIDIELDIERIIDDVKEKSRYKLLDTSLVFSGVCPCCA